MKTTTKIFNSLSELAQIKKLDALESWNARRRKPAKRENDASWAGETFASAFQKLESGDVENAKNIRAEGEILAKLTGGQPQLSSAVVGCVPNVPAYLRGVPKTMLRVDRTPRKTPVIDLYILTAIHSGITTTRATRTAAKIANVVAAIEAGGVNINLYAAHSCIGRKGDFFGVVVKMKNATAPLNLLNIAFPLVNPAFCRVVGIHAMQVSVEYESQWDTCGRVASITETKKAMKREGLYLSLEDLITTNATVEDITKIVNDYLANKDN